MRMRKQQFRIGHLAKELGVDDFVIRFWEKEFKLPTHRSKGGQRFYSSDDVMFFKRIQELLHQKGFTIAGAKRELSQKISLEVAPDLLQETVHRPESHEIDELLNKCSLLRKKLITLRNII